MAKVEADIEVQRFGYHGDGAGRRLAFPHAHTHKIEGRAGLARYGAADCTFENLEGRLDTLRWGADAASIGSAWLREEAERYDVAVERAEFPKGVRLVRAADASVELISPHVTFAELRLTAKGPFGRSRPADPVSAPAPVS